MLDSLIAHSRGRLGGYCRGLSALMLARFGKRVGDGLKIENDKEKGEKDKDAVCSILFSPASPVSGVQYSGSKIVFTENGKTVGIMHELLHGKIYILDVSVTGFSAIGLGLKSLFPNISSLQLGNSGAQGSCNICNVGGYMSGSPVWQASDGCTKPPATHSIQLELNQTTHTLHFFLDGRQIAHTITSVPTDVYFGVCSWSLNSLSTAEVRSLRMVSVTSTDAKLACMQHGWC